MNSQSLLIRIKLVCSLICLTIFAPCLVWAQSQDETLQFVLTRLRDNDNANSTAFADRIEHLIESGELHIIDETSSPKMEGDTSSCGWTDVNEGDLNTLHLVSVEPCLHGAHLILIHEYEHLRIYREEVFENVLELKRQHIPLTKEKYRQKEIDFLLGYVQYKRKMNGSPTFNVDEKNAFYSYLLFKIYTESKAYATTRNHVGNFILRGMTDVEIASLLIKSYTSTLLPVDIVKSLVSTATSSKNYDDFIKRTTPLRTPEGISTYLNLNAQAP